METNEKQGFDQWAVVEIMGHKQVAGHVTEEVIAGSPFLRIDVPAVGGVPARTTYHGSASIYAITPCTEELATKAAERLQRQMGAPLPVYVPDLEEAHRVIAEAERMRATPVAALSAGKREEPEDEDEVWYADDERDDHPF